MDEHEPRGVRFIQRYRPFTRMNHWTVVIAFLLAAISGLSLFHPWLFPLSALVGGGSWARILHPFIGIIWAVAFVVLALQVVKDTFLDGGDREWLRNWRAMLRGDEEGLPLVGRYNAGQKLVFWVMVASVVALFLTGLVIWRAYFSQFFPIGLIRFSTLVHAGFGVLIVGTIIIHAYAAFWVKGSVRAMTQGKVTWGWAWRHHRLWFRDVIAGRRPPD